MRERDKRVASMLRRDIAMLALFLVVFLGISAFAFSQVQAIVEDPGTAVLLTAAFLLVVVVLTSSIGWVIAYLIRSQKEIYPEDLHYQDLIRSQKEDGTR